MTQGHTGNMMQAKTGKLEGKGQVIGPGGEVKAEFTISSDVTEKQVEEHFMLTPENWEEFKADPVKMGFFKETLDDFETKKKQQSQANEQALALVAKRAEARKQAKVLQLLEDELNTRPPYKNITKTF